MTEKNMMDHNDHTESSTEYTFMQETIRPQRKQRGKHFAMTIVFAIVFGIVCSFVFCITLPVWLKLCKLELTKDTSDQDPIINHTVEPVVTMEPTVTY